MMKTPKVKVTSGIQKVIIDELISLGVSPNVLGYEYTKVALCYILENPQSVYSITKELYPAVAEEVGSTPSRVERALRHAVEKLYNDCDPDMLEKYFGLVSSRDKGKVTNSQFLSVMAERIRKKVGAYNENHFGE